MLVANGNLRWWFKGVYIYETRLGLGKSHGIYFSIREIGLMALLGEPWVQLLLLKSYRCLWQVQGLWCLIQLFLIFWKWVSYACSRRMVWVDVCVLDVCMHSDVCTYMMEMFMTIKIFLFICLFLSKLVDPLSFVDVWFPRAITVLVHMSTRGSRCCIPIYICSSK